MTFNKQANAAYLNILQIASNYTIVFTRQFFLVSKLMKDPGVVEVNSAFERSCCPLTNALDIFGDKWTLLIIRDLVLGKRRYQEFLSSPEKIASNILAHRLKKLEAAGLITRQPYQQSPVRYECFLTEKGESLSPVLTAIISWSRKHYPDTQPFQVIGQREESNSMERAGEAAG
ncbi:DNA-binding transcriptional regulator, HxlR family [Nitrosospira briensis]|uniref:DNA-binding transcriptional regulator, HxlR family n=2 Tax=Nitrosospira briensis TaxID=35799 RepID=A0A1I4YXX5_9PROT|nr:DNA-binding transcriptional regulator, HxlR family [Nitrosospira briensis]